MTTSRFCPQCGAANAPTNVLCHACQQSLETTADLQETPTLLNERYTVLAQIGAGGFGAVYRARDTWEQHRIVAIKQINLKGLSPQEIIEATDAFNREAQILTALSHPLLPRISDRFSDPEHWYLVMNFIDGSTLDEYLQQHAANALPARSGLPLEETLTIGLHLCDVLHYLHTQQPPVIFRDIKPGNIMRTPNGRLYLIDFGIARHFKPGQAKDTVPFGSPGFAAPEQYGRAQTTPQADIYSLGALLYCLISGDDPADHPFQFPPLRLYSLDGIRELDALIQRMVALDPAQRPVDIAEVRADIQALQRLHVRGNQQPIWLPPQGQTPPDASIFQQQLLFRTTNTPARKTSRRGLITAALLVGGAVLVGGVVTTLGNNQPQYTPTYQSEPIEFDPDAATATAQSDEATATATNQLAAVPANGPTYWSPDLSYAAVTNLAQNQIEIYKVPSQQSLLNIPIAPFSSPTVQWSSNNSKILAQADTGMIQAWDTTNGQKLFTFTSAMDTNAYNSIITAWSPDGTYCAINYPNITNLSTSTFVTILRSSDGKQIFQTNLPNDGNYSGNIPLGWSPDSRYLVFATASSWPSGTAWSAEIRDSQTSQQVNTFGGTLSADDSNISFIVWLPKGKQIATIINSDIWITDVASNQTNLVFENTFLGLLSPVWSPDETLLAALAGGDLVVGNATSGQQIRLNNSDLSDNLVAFAWSADSKSITVVDNNNVMSTLSVK